MSQFYHGSTCIVILLLITSCGFFNNEEAVNKSTESALDILNKRYAKGEIGQEEYARIKKELL